MVGSHAKRPQRLRDPSRQVLQEFLSPPTIPKITAWAMTTTTTTTKHYFLKIVKSSQSSDNESDDDGGNTIKTGSKCQFSCIEGPGAQMPAATKQRHPLLNWMVRHPF
mmetsp:Transcript_106326/g.195193  ORF Transcript_106326/g.195193 Transcript_106326/m.195193 type:complete len:108 (+) Transcript_106326:586-909(+)